MTKNKDKKKELLQATALQNQLLQHTLNVLSN